jgi:DNA-binding LytR/AlgR family response regulator
MKKQLFFHRDSEKLDIPNIQGDIEIINFRDIIYVTYDKPYCGFFYMEKAEKKKIFFQVSLVHVELNLPQVFFRCNHSTIINFRYLKTISYSSNQLSMEDGNSFSLSRRKVKDFKNRKELLDRLPPSCE